MSERVSDVLCRSSVLLTWEGSEWGNCLCLEGQALGPLLKFADFHRGLSFHYRSLLVVGIQLACIAMANISAFVAWSAGDITTVHGKLLAQGLPIIVSCYSCSAVIFGLQHTVWRRVDSHDWGRVLWVSTGGLVLSLTVLHGLLGWVTYPRSVIILTAIFSWLYLAGARSIVYLFRERMLGRTFHEGQVFGRMEEPQSFLLNNGFRSIEEILATQPAGLRLDIGCGYYKPKGYVGIDNLVGRDTQIENVENQPDILMDLNQGRIPLPDESCIEIRSSHFLEHSNLSWIIDESHRLLKPGGEFNFIVPYANSAEGMYPGHSIFLTERWFLENRNFQARYRIIKIKYDASLYWKTSLLRFVVPFTVARKFLFNACWQMSMHCKKKTS